MADPDKSNVDSPFPRGFYSNQKFELYFIEVQAFQNSDCTFFKAYFTLKN